MKRYTIQELNDHEMLINNSTRPLFGKIIRRVDSLFLLELWKSKSKQSLPKR